MSLNEEEKSVLQEINKLMIEAYRAQIDLIDASIYEENREITKEDIQEGLKIQ